MNDEAQLLRRYAETRAEDAFTQFVQRSIDLVYGAALRRTGDPHTARDVTQQVFVAAARQAAALSHHTTLSGWLYATTRNVAVNIMRQEQRRRVRETAASTEQ